MASLSLIRKYNKKLTFFGVLSLLSVLSGCDSGSGDSIGPKPDITLSGTVVKGTVVGAPVNIYRASSSTISNIPNIEGSVDNLYTDSSGNFSIKLNGDDYRNRTLVVQVGVAQCTTSSAEYVEANSGCTNTNGNIVELDDNYFVGEYRCDDPDNGCLHPETGATVSFGEMLPIDFELRSVVPLLSNSNSVRSQTANVSALTTIAATQITEYAQLQAEAAYNQTAKVFQLDGIDLLTQSIVDVSNLSSSVSNVNTWLMSAVNAAVTVTASQPSSGSPARTMGEGLTSLIEEFEGYAYQLVYRYSANNDLDLESIYQMAQNISEDQAVVGFISETASSQVTDILASVNAAADDPNIGENEATNEEVDADILEKLEEGISDMRTFMFDYMDWYSENAAPGTGAYTKFEFMLESTRGAARESMGYMETLGNDFTLVLAAALDQILDTSWDGSDFTINSQDKDGNAVTATLSRSGDNYTIQGDFLNTAFDVTFTYRETTNDDGVMPDNPPEEEEDDRVYRFDIEEDGTDVTYAASNEGLTLKFEDDVAVSIQVDSGFDGTDATVVRSSFAWGDILLAQTDLATYDQDLGRVTLDGQLVFSMEHVADSIIRFNDTYTATESYNVPRVDGRAFVFLQFGIYSATNPTPTKFRLTVADTNSQTGDTWPVSFLYAILNQENEQGEFYGAEGFGSFDQDYLTDVWDENDCDFLPVTYTILFDQNTSDNDTFNDIEVTLPNSDGTERDLTYSVAFTKQKSQLQASTENTKDPARLCSVNFTSGDNSTDINFYKTGSMTETGSFMGRSVTYLGFNELSNRHSLLFSESSGTEENLESRSATSVYDDCENIGPLSGLSGGSVGSLYNCTTPSVSADDSYCLSEGIYSDFTGDDQIFGDRIGREFDDEGNEVIVVLEDNYASCSSGEDWEIRYANGTIQVLPVDLELFGVPSN
ncbi:hypothetical protein ACFOEK_11030 [Litoribrevibacter euphylliae]|uniref:Carboxypeptidase regulatory-like domain-containing protein n=1 Tax=Litoribrevibacter euphylliae TaxID=1834034 RepID=A0ABV7HFQ4_9GAMM